MKAPLDHLVYLRGQSFTFACSTTVFPEEEIKALLECGNWLSALAAGEIQPVTIAQEHFLRVDRGEAQAETVFERAWVRLKFRKEFEREQRMTPPQTTSQDYGIVEWDEDRWW